VPGVARRRQRDEEQALLLGESSNAGIDDPRTPCPWARPPLSPNSGFRGKSGE
jgi:hypothetical protein